MQLFIFIKNYMVDLGLYRPDSIIGFKYKYQTYLFLIGMMTVLMGIPLFHMNTLSDFATSSYGASQIAVVVGCASSMLSRLSNIFKLIDKFEEILQKCKFQKSNGTFSSYQFTYMCN